MPLNSGDQPTGQFATTQKAVVDIPGEIQKISSRLNEIYNDLESEKVDGEKQRAELEKLKSDIKQSKGDITDTKNITVLGFWVLTIMLTTIVVMVLLSWSDSNARVIDSNAALQEQIYEIQLSQNNKIPVH